MAFDGPVGKDIVKGDSHAAITIGVERQPQGMSPGVPDRNRAADAKTVAQAGLPAAEKVIDPSVDPECPAQSTVGVQPPEKWCRDSAGRLTQVGAEFKAKYYPDGQIESAKLGDTWYIFLPPAAGPLPAGSIGDASKGTDTVPEGRLFQIQMGADEKVHEDLLQDNVNSFRLTEIKSAPGAAPEKTWAAIELNTDKELVESRLVYWTPEYTARVKREAIEAEAKRRTQLGVKTPE